MCGSADQGIRSDQITEGREIVCGAASSVSNTCWRESWITLILLSVPNTRWGDVTRRKIPTEDDHFGDEVHFYAVVKHFSDPIQRDGVIQPHVRENEKIEVGELLLDPNRISCLDKHRLSAVKIHL